jgi:hypothetical protein
MSVTAALENLAGEFTQACLAERSSRRSLSERIGQPASRQRLALQSDQAFYERDECEAASSSGAADDPAPAIPPSSPPPLPGLDLPGSNFREALSRTFSPQELELAAWLRRAELREEYAILRLFLLRIMQMTTGIETLAEMIDFINLYGMSLLRLAKILETLNGGEDGGERLTRDLLEVADQVLKEKQQVRTKEVDDDQQNF